MQSSTLQPGIKTKHVASNGRWALGYRNRALGFHMHRHIIFYAYAARRCALDSYLPQAAETTQQTPEYD